jgi:hypothetical protein
MSDRSYLVDVKSIDSALVLEHPKRKSATASVDFEYEARKIWH